MDDLLSYLSEVGFEAAPRPLGRDSQGRQVLEYVPGKNALDELPRMDVTALARVGALIRRLHDATADYQAPARAAWEVVLKPDHGDEWVCHNDLAPWNLIVGDDERWVLIDWDSAGPSSRIWEIAYAAHGFVGLAEGNDPVQDAERLSALVDGYQLGDEHREDLCRSLAAPTRAMYELLTSASETGDQPWARLHADGHAEHWGPAADYIERNMSRWRRALL